MKRILVLLAIVAASIAAALAPAASTRTADYYDCTHYCDWIPYGEQWCGIDHWYDQVFGPDAWYVCDRYYTSPNHMSFQWYPQSY